MPPERLLLETDHPFGDRSESAHRRPDNLAKGESAVSAPLGAPPDTVQRWTCRNLKVISEKPNLVKMFHHYFQVQFLAV